MMGFNKSTYAVVRRDNRTQIVAGPDDGLRGGGLAAPFYGNDLEDAKNEVKLTFAVLDEANMPTDEWLEYLGWDVVPMNAELEAQYDALFNFEEL
jgi:hypothetical protein